MVILGTFIIMIMSLVMAFVSFLMACEGFIWIILIAVVVFAIINWIKK